MSKKCSFIDLSAYHAAIDALPAGATLVDRDAAYKAHPGVKCTRDATHRVEMYAEHEDDDSMVHVCTEHLVSEGWEKCAKEDPEGTAIFRVEEPLS